MIRNLCSEGSFPENEQVLVHDLNRFRALQDLLDGFA
jgi:hypothetical protein